MGGEDVAATFDRLAKCIAGLPRFDAGGDHVDDFIPGAGADFLIDAAVGEDFNAVLQKRDDNQDSRVIAGVVQALIGKRREGQSVNRLADAALGREHSFYSWQARDKESD